MTASSTQKGTEAIPPRELTDIVGDYVAFGTHWVKFTTASIFNFVSFLVLTPYKIIAAPFEYTEQVSGEKWNLTALYYDTLSFPVAFTDSVSDYTRFQKNLWNGVGYNWLGYKIGSGDRVKSGLIKMDENTAFYQTQTQTITSWAAQIAEQREEDDKARNPERRT